MTSNPTPSAIRFTNGRQATHALVTNSGTVHYAADCATRPYHVLACNGRAMSGLGAQVAQTTGIDCKACSKLEVQDVVGMTETPHDGPEVPIVSAVSKAANFEYGWNGLLFFTERGELVAVAR